MYILTIVQIFYLNSIPEIRRNSIFRDKFSKISAVKSFHRTFVGLKNILNLFQSGSGFRSHG
jgi:hypothetical protein